MSTQDAPQATPPAAARSWKLTTAVIILAILPPVLPFPLALVALKWILPVIVPVWSPCPPSCPPSTDGERLEWLLILGPSLLVAVASILSGEIGRFRARRHPTSPKNMALLRASAVCGVVWALLLGCLYGVIFYVVGIVP